MSIKQCRYCGEMKDENEFERRHGGLASNKCRACAALYHRKRYRKTEDGKKMLLKGRVSSLRNFCEKHGLDLTITVKKGDDQWI